MLDIVHDAVRILLDLNDDPTHLFGYDRGEQTGHVLLSVMPKRLAQLRDHLNQLFSTDEGPFIPHAIPPLSDTIDGANPAAGPGAPWAFNARQFRRTLAWHIAHQPFGVVAGAKQYKHAKPAMFDGYAGTSASGFAAEVAAEETVALLDYAEELYRDWNDGGRAGGGATARIDAEFTRIRRELGDLPGVIANPNRLRTMLGHLTKTLHPGVLNDCFYQPAAALCAKRARPASRPPPLLDTCSTCPNARRSTILLPRLTAARDQARHLLDPTAPHLPMPPLQRAALHQHLTTLTTLIAEITDPLDADGTCA